MFEGGSTIGSPGGAAIAPVPQLPVLEDQRLASVRAQQRVAALGEMTGGIAHDFRNILAVIGSGLSLAERSHARGEAFDIYLQAARDGVERGLRLTARLLAFAKPGRLRRDLQDINALIRELAIFLKYGAGSGNVIVFDLAEPLPLCRVDPTRFNAAILNLVVNARDAMPDGGRIRISTCPFETSKDQGAPRTGDYVILRVEDTGQGMSAETLRKVFDPYFTTKGRNGTGLGVPQVKAFMQSLGGNIRVCSEPGVGTSCDLLFPVGENEGAWDRGDASPAFPAGPAELR